jgi:hypothetical protein
MMQANTKRNEELHNLYSAPNIFSVIKSRRMRWAGNETRTGEMGNAYKIFIGKPTWKRQIGRPRRRWEDNIRTYLREIGWDYVDYIHVAHDRDQWWALVSTVINHRFL